MQMSYNNYLDGDAAYTAVCDIPQPACVVVKHTNPCGAATREDLLEAYRLAVRADPISAFGGIVAFNRWACAGLFLRFKCASGSKTCVSAWRPIGHSEGYCKPWRGVQTY